MQRFQSWLIPVALVFGGVGWIFQEALGGLMVDYVFDHLAGFLGIERARMIAAVAPYVLPAFVTWGGLYGAYRIGVTERLSFEPEPDVDARHAFAAVINDKRWLKQHTETDPAKLSHLRSDYLKVRLANEIHSALAQAKLWGWGELNMEIGTGPLDRIPPSKWHDIAIDFSSRDDELRTIARSRTSGKMAYADMRFSASQFAKFFHIRQKLLRRPRRKGR